MAREQHSGSGGTELGRFLRARRTRVTPGDVGLPVSSGVRRTPGLRREELATLAGISIDYYARLERGTETRPSPSVIDAIARVLRLEEAEHKHLRELAASADGHVTASATVPSRSLPPGTQLILESLRPNPAYVVGRTFELLAANPGGLRLFAGIEDWQGEQRNLARYVFLHPTARELWDDWDNAVRSCVAWLRGLAGIEPGAPDLALIVDELLRKSPEFVRMWDRYDVRGNTGGRHAYHHPEVGDLALGYQGMTLNGTNGQHLVVFYAEPDTRDYDAMVLLDKAARDARDRASKPSASPAQ
ncbi:helix-turn-helix domain-containing protein [Streptomyces asoensis]|uniref:Helix-turn-helix domain-containing protein n=1 Tax=Streptomyces asoensis TaxID=249586 RepID=A0A6M4WII5_9ACTN|nr:helix-turn-helix transcriptional regulator [Streptomyces asoensis]QJS99857.1 helix-turn-helix domain-containing protein [Streptomyces asoensis]